MWNPFGFLKRSKSDEFSVTNDEEHNAAYSKANELISPHLFLTNRTPSRDSERRTKLLTGVTYLNAVLEYAPTNWAALWMKGKAYQALGNLEGANSAFGQAFEIQHEHADVAREYALSCVELGMSREAEAATRHAIDLRPDDAGLYANLAVALLIGGHNVEAQAAVGEALEMDPADKISQALFKMVDDVICGRRKQPISGADFRK